MEGESKIKKGIFSKTAEPISTIRIYVDETNMTTCRKKFEFYLFKIRLKKWSQIWKKN